MYLDDCNNEQYVDLNSAWVETHFDHALLAYVQQSAYDSLEPVIYRDSNGKLQKKMGFVDVSAENIEIIIDDTVFHKI